MTARAAREDAIGAQLEDGGRVLRVERSDGAVLRLPAAYVADHALGARDPISGQRRLGAGALDALETMDEAILDGDFIAVRFRGESALRRLPLGDLWSGEDVPAAFKKRLWTTPEAVAGLPTIPFDAYLAEDAALCAALSRAAQYGLVLLCGAGSEPLSVERLIARFGAIRETNYGRVFDVRVKAQAANLADTAMSLDLHTDNPYRNPPPTLQALHVLQASPSGGESVFVDGFAHAEALRSDAPEDFRRLSREMAGFTYATADGRRWRARAPILDVDVEGAVRTVRLNHRSLDAPVLDGERLGAWYSAYRGFYARVHAPGAGFERRLAVGDIALFDNRRILHGRRGFAAEGERWLQGAYADMDGALAVLHRLTAGGAALRRDGDDDFDTHRDR